MTYKCLPRWMVKDIVSMGNEFLNTIEEDCIGDGLTPRNIIDNLPHIDCNGLKYGTGEYVQIRSVDDNTNSMQAQTVGAIVGSPRNITGRYNFMSLETGPAINGRVA